MKRTRMSQGWRGDAVSVRAVLVARGQQCAGTALGQGPRTAGLNVYAGYQAPNEYSGTTSNTRLIFRRRGGSRRTAVEADRSSPVVMPMVIVPCLQLVAASRMAPVCMGSLLDYTHGMEPSTSWFLTYRPVSYVLSTIVARRLWVYIGSNYHLQKHTLLPSR